MLNEVAELMKSGCFNLIGCVQEPLSYFLKLHKIEQN